MITLSACTGQQENKMTTADEKATQVTLNLFSNLSRLTEKGIMFGHQDDLSYGMRWVYPDGESDIKRIASDFPAVYGMDLGHLELGYSLNLDSVPFEDMKTFVREIYAWGGIVTFSWHADNPLTGGSAWDVSSDKAVASVLPGGENHEKYKEWLGRLADFFISLKDEQGETIPVIFRPYHEHIGSWFWWGQKLCSRQEYVSLWQFTVDYMRNNRNVHNLLYAYSASDGFTSTSEYLERYPGDNYVDVLGFDYYHSQSFIKDVKKRLEIITSIAYEHRKVPALTETGYEAIPDSTWWTGVLWPSIKESKISYVLVWRNAHNRPSHYFAPWPGQKSEKDFVDFYNLPETLFQKEVTSENIYNSK